MKYVALNKVDNRIILRGDGCVTSIRELYKVLVEKDTTEIELRKEFIDANFTYNALCDFVAEAASLAPDVRVWAGDAIYDNTMLAVQEIKSYKQPDELIYAIEHNPTRVISTLQALCENYVQARDDANIANNKIATMLVQIADLQTKVNELKDVNNNVTRVKNDIEASLRALVSRINFRYEKGIDVGKMFQLHENSYNHILYVKELTRVHYTDTLLYYVRQIINTLYGMPVRMVVIEPYYSYGCETRYPDFVPHWDLCYRDVYSGDILMTGFQPKLMEDILQNSSHINYLIVLDRGGYRVPHISNSNVSIVYTVSDLKDVPSNVNIQQVISYSPDTLNIPYIPDFNELSPEARVTKYSSMPVTKKLINLLEEVK